MYNGEIAACRLARRSGEWQQYRRTREECIPLSEQPAQTECGSQVEWAELFTISIWNATFLVFVAKIVNNFVGFFFFFQLLLVWHLLSPSWIYFCRTRLFVPQPFGPLGHCSFLVAFRDLLQFNLFLHEQSTYSFKGNTMTQPETMPLECKELCVCFLISETRSCLFTRYQPSSGYQALLYISNFVLAEINTNYPEVL